MKTGESLLSIGKFIAEYSAHLMGAGVHTSRVVRNTKRIGEAFGLDVKLSVFHRNIILTIIDKETNEACNEVKRIKLGSSRQSFVIGRIERQIQEDYFCSADTSAFRFTTGRICQCVFLQIVRR